MNILDNVVVIQAVSGSWRLLGQLSGNCSLAQEPPLPYSQCSNFKCVSLLQSRRSRHNRYFGLDAKRDHAIVWISLACFRSSWRSFMGFYERKSSIQGIFWWNLLIKKIIVQNRGRHRSTLLVWDGRRCYSYRFAKSDGRQLPGWRNPNRDSAWQ